MKNKKTKLIAVMLFACLAWVACSDDEVLTDGEIKEKVTRYIAPKCSQYKTTVQLVDTYYIKGDTNRMMRLLSELVQTNDEWYCTRSMMQYGKYAGVSELPFLYSYATNSLCGHCALKSIFRIEGISTNSLSALERYLSLTNNLAMKFDCERFYLCAYIVDNYWNSDLCVQYHQYLKELFYKYSRNVSTAHINKDKLLQRIDDKYILSKRRLSMMRELQSCELNEWQTNYVEGVIKELEKYPEENLAD